MTNSELVGRLRINAQSADILGDKNWAEDMRMAAAVIENLDAEIHAMQATLRSTFGGLR